MTNYQEVYPPLTAGIRGEPVNYPVYALGCGISFANAVLNVTYEYSDKKFVHTWSNAVSFNREINTTIIATFTYEIPLAKERSGRIANKNVNNYFVAKKLDARLVIPRHRGV